MIGISEIRFNGWEYGCGYKCWECLFGRWNWLMEMLEGLYFLLVNRIFFWDFYMYDDDLEFFGFMGFGSKW